ncbi:MAG: hypothetical protein NT127_08560 [Sphingobacteriales bacterium]|nr:hypothetical protein [Sphingobacteriales bacterium]
MKFIRTLASNLRCSSLALVCLLSTATLTEKNLRAQNISLFKTPVLMYNTAGEITGFNIFQIVSNPANLNSLKKFNIGIYSERKFNLMELSNHLIVSGFSLGKIKMGLIIQQAGTSKFNQISLGLCLSKKIGDNTSLAIQSKLLRSDISKQHNQKYISAEVGLVTNLSKVVKLGFTAENYMSFNKQTNLDNAYVLNISTGVFYEISKQFSMHINCFKSSNESTCFSGNMSYQAHKKFALKLGFTSNTNALNTDIFYSGKKMNLALNMTFHPILGITPATSISTVND